MEVKEKIIQATTENWRVLFEGSSNPTSLILTNKRLILKTWMPGSDLFNASEESISLQEIKNIDIETKISNNPCIKFTYDEGVETHFRFFQTTPGTTFHVLLGDAGKVTAEITAYTAYWASLLTMAKFLYGSPEDYKK